MVKSNIYYVKKKIRKSDRKVQAKLMDFAPKESGLDEWTVQFYCVHARKLARSQTSKASKFISYGSIHYMGYDKEFKNPHTFLCLPLNQKNFDVVNDMTFTKKPYEIYYNNTAYKMWFSNGYFHCTCQGHKSAYDRKKDFAKEMSGIICSHTLALRYFILLNGFEGKESIPKQFRNTDEFFNFLEKKKKVHKKK